MSELLRGQGTAELQTLPQVPTEMGFSVTGRIQAQDSKVWCVLGQPTEIC